MLITALLALSQVSASHIEYGLQIRPQAGEATEVRMHLALQGDDDGETVLSLPSEWGGEVELWNGIVDLSVEGGELTTVDVEKPEQRVVEHAPGAELMVRWKVIQDREGVPTAAADNSYRPWLQPDYINLLGHTIFIRAERDADPITSDTPVTVHFDVPDSYDFTSDLLFGELRIGDLGPSVTVGGDFRITARMIDGAPVTVAVRGEMVDEQIVTATELAVRGNLTYWGDEAEPYLVTGLPLVAAPGRSSFGGTNVGDAFAIFGTSNVPNENLLRVLVHEHSHTWVPSRLGGLTQGPEQPGDYWFSEGFTDFVTTRAGLMSGAWDAAGAIAQLNEFLAEYMANPERDSPNTAIRDGFWTSAPLQRLPYLRGNLFALLIDHLIERETDGGQDLDDVLIAMRDAEEQGLAAHSLVDMVREVAGLDISALHQRHIIDGETIILPAETFGSCGKVESMMEPVFVYGLTLGENPNGEGFLIEAVDPDGPAAPAGFEAGMVLFERVGGAYGDATQDSAFRVRRADDEEQVLTYRPTNGEEALVQRIVRSDGDLTTNGCLKRLAGRAM